MSDLRTEPVLFTTRRALGAAIAAARQLARISRADLAAALGIDEKRLADFESGSLTLKRRY